MTPTPRLLAVSTAVPPYALGQAEVRDSARRLFSGRDTEIERLLTAFDNAGIETRYSCVPLA